MNTRLFLLLLVIHLNLHAQKKSYKIRTIAFYNLENLFDLKNDSLTYDDDRTPNGKDQWTEDRYLQKLNNLSKAMSEIGQSVSKSSPDIIGICEVENQEVVADLIYHKNLREKNYGIVHFDSPDERGIDVALLYKKNAFIPTSFKSQRLLLQNNEGYRDYTRDQLIVGGLLDNEQVYFIVNHWPSRSGGEARSKPNRIEAAKLNKRIIDSIKRTDASAKIISMGDLNDDPTSDSLRKILKTKGDERNLEENDLYNPMEKLHKKGIGSLAYRDKWNLFDQFFFTSNLISENKENYTYWKAGVFTPSYLLDPTGKYKGYPLRTYAGGNYVGGYSDHFPVYLYLIKAVPSMTSGGE
ncbi:endonuclease/exonuclease/phosphatase family protein [Cellulophaga sp. HaHa_2_95]|uniref:endonuclease/exonuclease/phosphatase family protein n=1 Tax=Cellulophaga sp. HaHa_2_95 TaxID=2745558 RepID=UPI001C4E94EC|nr:endonuclease/exonuclease/phosphatase family protein [Cellulophaga sp. HaHa_2_95]QXP56851.1 endonuclease/exonuclease/phosphatase family protein [Cellulophaga sp. HaHa_2_95]